MNIMISYHRLVRTFPNISFETKNRLTDKLFISNINNAKGLEFPFVICFARQLKYYPSFRNALYTMMARSFLESHLLLSKNTDPAVFSTISDGLNQLTLSNELNVRVPTAEEIEKQKDLFVLAEGLSIETTVKRYCESRKATPRLIAKIISTVSTMLEGIEDYSEEYLLTIVEAEYIRNKKL
ncbi:ATP-binding domain-containing protein [Aeromonas salmonicida]|uniref:ATP-binding domain-containing protein n=1 Tax=Aeromonas salmonicida TaxID=645 RepID=UPI00232F4709|nr:ATP-binding domain-containing protein [Aeromonas salmonicida]WCH26564.1 ATP-binding domain-containing protein [Aeromonas salmonicida]